MNIEEVKAQEILDILSSIIQKAILENKNEWGTK